MAVKLKITSKESFKVKEGEEFKILQPESEITTTDSSLVKVLLDAGLAIAIKETGQKLDGDEGNKDGEKTGSEDTDGDEKNDFDILETDSEEVVSLKTEYATAVTSLSALGKFANLKKEDRVIYSDLKKQIEELAQKISESKVPDII